MKYRFCNRNAWKDGKWDAEKSLGNCNQYNPGSLSWAMYEWAYKKWDKSGIVVGYIA